MSASELVDAKAAIDEEKAKAKRKAQRRAALMRQMVQWHWISAAICLRFRQPSSGTSASSVRLTTGPTPGTVRKRFSFARQTGLRSIVWSRSRSTS